MLTFLKRLFGRTTSIESIIAPMQKILVDLETYQAGKYEEAQIATSEAERLLAEAEAHSTEAERAQALVGAYRGLVNPTITRVVPTSIAAE